MSSACVCVCLGVFIRELYLSHLLGFVCMCTFVSVYVCVFGCVHQRVVLKPSPGVCVCACFCLCVLVCLYQSCIKAIS